ncbi:MAG: DUF4924 family protein [Prevotellaceae bacterium]|jgi:hypothetical protein|nr:DUF4924 family protein [Prevotellaceae bacterium]
MLIAKKKLTENIAEYVLYLWQIEDLLRALNFNTNLIREKLVEPLNLPEEKQEEVLLWYLDIIANLKDEEKEVTGHTCYSLQIISELNNLHLSLLKKGSKYLNLYMDARNDIILFREKSGKKASDLEIAFDALYAKLLLRLKGEQISDETSAAFDRIASLIAYLSATFHKKIQQKEGN